MRHAGSATLTLLAPLLARIRELGPLTERKPGTFYLRSTAFLHFHEDPQGLFADVKLNGSGFERFAVNTPEEHAALVARITEALRPASSRTSTKGSSGAGATPPVASTAELKATVQRMEKRFRSSQSLAIRTLMEHYRQLCVRFETDLVASPREVLLAKASALMLVQSVAQAENAA
jgi:hypothetical protein